jgi:hypothetical protein
MITYIKNLFKIEEIRNMMTFILIVILLAFLFFTTVALVKNIKYIREDPLNFGMKVNGFSSCSCLDNSSRMWTSNGSGFVTQQNPIIYNP